MLREEFLPIAAKVHSFGTRFLRDSAAVLFPCCTLGLLNIAFELRRVIDVSEQLMARSIELCEGLTETSSLTKYTALTEARTCLAGVDLDRGLTAKQSAAEKKHSVPVGKRADVYDGYIALSCSAIKAVNNFTAVCDRITGGDAMFALPKTLTAFLRKVCADYGAASALLEKNEAATLLCRKDDISTAENCLRHVSAASDIDAFNLTVEDLAARAGSGMISCVPPLLFDMLLRYRAV